MRFVFIYLLITCCFMLISGIASGMELATFFSGPVNAIVMYENKTFKTFETGKGLQGNRVVTETRTCVQQDGWIQQKVLIIEKKQDNYTIISEHHKFTQLSQLVMAGVLATGLVATIEYVRNKYNTSE